METDYLKGVEDERKAEYLQQKKEYIAVLGKVITAKAMWENARDTRIEAENSIDEVSSE